jgi:hypothetical protein
MLNDASRGKFDVETVNAQSSPFPIVFVVLIFAIYAIAAVQRQTSPSSERLGDLSLNPSAGDATIHR